MSVDYMTRWAKAMAAASVTAKEVAKFVFENICYWFDTQLEIFLDRGLGFSQDLMGELMKNLGIACCHSTPY